MNKGAAEPQKIKMKVEKIPLDEKHALFWEKETLQHRFPYALEKQGLLLIQNGEPEKLLSCMQELSKRSMYVGNLSVSDLRQAQYVSCIVICLSTRSAIEGGAPETVAFSFSDECLQRMDSLKTAEEVYTFTGRAALRFAMLSQQYKLADSQSDYIRACVDYINDHLHYPILIEDLADAVGLSPAYLSRFFKERTGISITAYCMECRLNEAQELLLTGKYSCGSIAALLGFSSQSYFIVCFKKRFRTTPGEFQRKYAAAPMIEKSGKIPPL